LSHAAKFSFYEIYDLEINDWKEIYDLAAFTHSGLTTRYRMESL